MQFLVSNIQKKVQSRRRFTTSKSEWLIYVSTKQSTTKSKRNIIKSSYKDRRIASNPKGEFLHSTDGFLL